MHARALLRPARALTHTPPTRTHAAHVRLLRRRRRQAAGRRVALLKSDKDVRYEVTYVVSHDGARQACFALPTLASFAERLGDVYRDAEVRAAGLPCS